MGVMDLIEKELFLEDAKKKICADCKTTKTPLWRGGPAGPKSLCNACGIRYRKRKVSMVGMRRRAENKRDKTLSHATSSSSQRTTSKSDENDSENAGDADNQSQSRIVASDKAVVLKKQAQAMKKQRLQKKIALGEEAAAAVSLMALSCGSLFA